ncbi:hypothetical protein L873DRAFT_1923490 [Choiromyces venosus 120613-1]|uniref:Uncharacterized protein n=1 Tax=Choiromyces venosus 120613-1 TaxID=1336337 RepID=A0A3N4JET7_9PEZI|nr:hypothetical protein L873DRAFT_1923490 [Choiromyces venosus 120613-1]
MALSEYWAHSTTDHAMLNRMKTQSNGKLRLRMAALTRISSSEQPMSISELCHVLGV